MAYWNTVNGGSNAVLWTNSAAAGSLVNVTSTNLSYTATNLASATSFFFTFRATNAAFNGWATNVLSFTTLAAIPPEPILSGDVMSFPSSVPSFGFSTVTGYQYRLVYKNMMTDVAWFPVIDPPDFPLPDGWSIPSTGAAMWVQDPAVGLTQRFYRLESESP